MRLRLHNIGPIRDADISVSPLTVLVGPNGSGKTTLTSVLYASILAHVVATERAFRMLDNPFSRTAREPRRLRGAALTRAIVDEWERTFADRMGFELRRCCAPDLTDLGRARRGGKGAGPRIELGTQAWSVVFRVDGDDLFLEKDHPRYKRPTVKIPSNADYRSAREAVEAALHSDMPTRAIYFPAGRSGFVQTHTALSALVLGALSGGYFQDATLGTIPGATADFMRFVAQISSKKRTRRTGPIARELEAKLLRGRVRLEEDGSSREMLFRPEGHDHEWPLQNMATSVAELSPLVLYLRHVAATGDALLIDEPESHLHPESQVALAEGLISVASSVSPVIVATHSEVLGLGAQQRATTRSDKRPAH